MFAKKHQEKIEFHLSKVSRSFALAIKVLDQPLKDCVGLSYLLFRVLDTVEDAKWTSRENQEKGFFLLDKIIAGEGSSEEFIRHVLENSDLSSISKGEMHLIGALDNLIQRLSEVPPAIRTAIGHSLSSMSRGMQYFVLRDWDRFQLNSVFEVNHYCYFVAGLVGELLTRILFLSRNEGNEDVELLQKSVEFGLFLQKVNILKDQLADEKIGRFLVPDRLTIRKSLLAHADASMDYILKIHRYSKPYAFFCLLSLFLGMISIPYIDSSFRLKKLAKPSREATLKLFAKLQSMISQPEQIMAYYNELRVRLEVVPV